MKPKVLKPEHKQHVPSARRMVRVFSLLRELEAGVNMENFCLRYGISRRQLERDLALLQRARYPVYIPEAHYRKLLKGP